MARPELKIGTGDGGLRGLRASSGSRSRSGSESGSTSSSDSDSSSSGNGTSYSSSASPSPASSRRGGVDESPDLMRIAGLSEPELVDYTEGVITQLEADLKSVRQELIAATRDKLNMRARLKSLQKFLQKDQDELERNFNEVDLMKDQLTESLQQNSRVKDLCSEAQRGLLVTEEELQVSQKEHQDISKKSEYTHFKHQSFDEHRSTLYREVADLQRRLSGIRAQITSTKKELSWVVTDKKKLEGECSIAQTLEAEVDERLQAAAEDKRYWKEIYLKSTRQKQTIEERLGKLDRQRAALQEKMVLLTNEVMSREGTLGRVSGENKKLLSVLNRSEAQSRSLRKMEKAADKRNHRESASHEKHEFGIKERVRILDAVINGVKEIEKETQDHKLKTVSEDSADAGRGNQVDSPRSLYAVPSQDGRTGERRKPEVKKKFLFQRPRSSDGAENAGVSINPDATSRTARSIKR